MKYSSLLVILLLQINCVFGQRKHELKLDLAAITNNYIVYYETVLSKRVGVETALGFDFANIYLIDLDYIASTYESYKFSTFRFNPSVGAK